MSQTVMTAAFGPTDRYRGTPRGINVLADLVVGGSAVFIFRRLDGPATVRLRPVDVPVADVLMAGFALVAGVPLDTDAATVAVTLQAEKRDIPLTADQAAVLRDAVSGFAVSLVITGVETEPSVSALDFGESSWSVFSGVAQRR